MKPQEFWSCTYREARIYVESNVKQNEEDLKEQVILFEALGNKLIAGSSYKPKRINLITDTFKNIFKDELEKSKQSQSFEEQIKILRSWM